MTKEIRKTIPKKKVRKNSLNVVVAHRKLATRKNNKNLLQQGGMNDDIKSLRKKITQNVKKGYDWIHNGMTKMRNAFSRKKKQVPENNYMDVEIPL